MSLNIDNIQVQVAIKEYKWKPIRMLLMILLSNFIYLLQI